MEDLSDYQKLDFLNRAIQKAMDGNTEELEQALDIVESLREYFQFIGT